ncbi:basic helix-loop-helix (bHLH) DNA-bindingsuperfamily protein [Striga asiatica]|uniref:Basic helix-loop-helix (BHLH) DNA-bindingsuperfamily protein n=1 Tax=Striga asiatica TaxID=4170 RepID=A0A5A7RCM8_STRAF|nr:basic helix-loop-helix (bHLH) DNA-bindingsuperfamily protein [Striga asiatica]
MNNNQQQNVQAGPGSGLTRYRSAPSSYFASMLEDPQNDAVFGGGDFDHLFSPRTSGPVAQTVLSRFTGSTVTVRGNSSATNGRLSSQLPAVAKAEPSQPLQRQQSNDYTSASPAMYHESRGTAVENSYGGFMGSYGGSRPKMESGGGGNSGLLRQSSSPAGIFDDIDIETEFGNNSKSNANAEASSSSSSAGRFKRQMDFSSRYSSSGMMNTIPENNMENRHFSRESGNNVDYITGLPMSSWDDSDCFLQGLQDNNESRRFSSANASDDQNNEGGNRHATRLSHHLSLPTNSAELEKILQDTVPCKMRAKRGFATHPRSIAERVRRTKISERIRKLQELVPNMEKQTNTSDMLDLAVDYIKDLQRQVKTLCDNRSRCSCPAKQNL